MSVLLAMCTAPNDEVAKRLACALVEEGLAACVNRIAGRSTYRWQGDLHDADEVLLLIKTRRERLQTLKARLATLHPYEVPELLVFEVADGFAPYLAWVEAQTQPQ